MKICLVSDNPNSWIHPHVKRLKELLTKAGHRVTIARSPAGIPKGDLAFFIGCERIASQAVLARNRHNLVIHESALPRGRGWSPLTWQILQGRNRIPITLFEAATAVDSGVVYYRDVMVFEGHELVEELRAEQGRKTISLVLRFVRSFPHVRGLPQKGRASFYAKRTPRDSEVMPTKTIREIFNHLRVADNVRYPVFFRMKGHKYILKIEKADS